MSDKIIFPQFGEADENHIGVAMDSLFKIIKDRKFSSSNDNSYTVTLLDNKSDILQKKIAEEATELALALKDLEHIRARFGEYSVQASEETDHVRYEAGDIVYHLLCALAYADINIDELAAELNMRMKPEERPENCILLKPEFVRRGK